MVGEVGGVVVVVGRAARERVHIVAVDLAADKTLRWKVNLLRRRGHQHPHRPSARQLQREPTQRAIESGRGRVVQEIAEEGGGGGRWGRVAGEGGGGG